MKTPNQGVDFLNAGDFLRTPHRVDDAAVTAGGDDHQAPIADLKAGCVFMPMLVRHGMAGELLGGEMMIAILDRIAADAVLLAIYNERVRQHAFDAVAWHDTGGEGVFLNYDGQFGQHWLHVVLLEVMPIQYPVSRERTVGLLLHPMAERILAAHIKPQILPHGGSVCLQEADQSAKVIKVPVAEDQRIQIGSIDLQQLQIVRQNIRGESKIQQIAAGIGTLR